jgi:dTDP-4-dehydrorhamnose reductase
MLGSDLVPQWDREREVLALSRSQCDVAVREQVSAALDGFSPDLVLLLAAATDVDRCQRDRTYAFRSNAFGTEVTAAECGMRDIPLVFISTIAVFDGHKNSPYIEYDLPSPANQYGRSKLFGEEAVRTFSPRHWIVRTGWLFGGGPKDMKFVAKILGKASGADRISVVRDCVGSPTYTCDLAAGILRLCDGYPFGTYHLVNSGEPASRYELARHIMRIAGFSPDLVVPCLSNELGLDAPRPPMEAAASVKLALLDGSLDLPDWRDSLSSYISSRLSVLYG